MEISSILLTDLSVILELALLSLSFMYLFYVLISEFGSGFAGSGFSGSSDLVGSSGQLFKPISRSRYSTVLRPTPLAVSYRGRSLGIQVKSLKR